MGPSWRRHYGWQRGFRGNNSLPSQRINQLGEQIPKLYGPDYRHDLSSSAGDEVLKVPHVLLLPGGIVIKIGEETVAALGVAGAPGGDKDEACTRAALDKISGQLK
jgi:hypothetical protein